MGAFCLNCCPDPVWPFALWLRKQGVLRGVVVYTRPRLPDMYSLQAPLRRVGWGRVGLTGGECFVREGIVVWLACCCAPSPHTHPLFPFHLLCTMSSTPPPVIRRNGWLGGCVACKVLCKVGGDQRESWSDSLCWDENLIRQPWYWRRDQWEMSQRATTLGLERG